MAISHSRNSRAGTKAGTSWYKIQNRKGNLSKITLGRVQIAKIPSGPEGTFYPRVGQSAGVVSVTPHTPDSTETEETVVKFLIASSPSLTLLSVEWRWASRRQMFHRRRPRSSFSSGMKTLSTCRLNLHISSTAWSATRLLSQVCVVTLGRQ